MPAPSAGQWSAARRLYETTAASCLLIAGAMGCNRSTVSRRAQSQGWERKERSTRRAPKDAAPGFDFAALEALANGSPASVDGGEGNGAEAAGGDEAFYLDAIDRLRVTIGRAADRIVADAERRGGRVDLAALGLLSDAKSVLERTEKLAFPLRAQQQKRSDDELAGMLRKIDDRIIELAEAHAGWLVAERDREREN